MTFPESPEALGAALKAERLRKGLNLAAISQATKVTESHFVALERGDLRHWPKGIFRRSFFSDYVRALGLPVEPALAVFARVFPDELSPAPPVTADAAPLPASELRLSLANSPWTAPGARVRARVAAGDAAFIALLGGFIAWLTPASAALAIAVTALVYYSLVTILGTDSLAVRLQTWARRPTWPMRPAFPGMSLPTLAVSPRAREWTSAMPRFIPHVSITPLIRALHATSSGARDALARALELTRKMSVARTTSVHDEADAVTRLRLDASQPRHERRSSPRSMRARPSVPSVRVRIRLTR